MWDFLAVTQCDILRHITRNDFIISERPRKHAPQRRTLPRRAFRAFRPYRKDHG